MTSVRTPSRGRKSVKPVPAAYPATVPHAGATRKCARTPSYCELLVGIRVVVAEAAAVLPVVHRRLRGPLDELRDLLRGVWILQTARDDEHASIGVVCVVVRAGLVIVVDDVDFKIR